MVYAHPAEALEWREYIDYLQTLDYLTGDVEELELEDLPGAQGLRALRVTADLTRPEDADAGIARPDSAVRSVAPA